MAKAARVSLDWLVGGEGEMEQSHAPTSAETLRVADYLGEPGAAEARAEYSVSQDQMMRMTTELIALARKEASWERAPAAWTTLVQELMMLHGLSFRAAVRILETAKAREQEVKGTK